MKTKPDEIAMMKRALEFGPYKSLAFKEIPPEIPEKRFFFILEKWTKRGWWDYGVSARTGWLTEEGHMIMSVLVSP